MGSRWMRPEVYPLFAAMGFAVSICGFQSIRSICFNPGVRVNKEKRLAGFVDNEEEGKKYTEHAVRKFFRNRAPEYAFTINFADSTPN